MTTRRRRSQISGAEARAKAIFKKKKLEEVGRFSGKQLTGLTYAPLFPYFAGRDNCFQVLSGEFVTTGDGTGIVHLAPAYGEDDFAEAVEASNV